MKDVTNKLCTNETSFFFKKKVDVSHKNVFVSGEVCGCMHTDTLTHTNRLDILLVHFIYSRACVRG